MTRGNTKECKIEEPAIIESTRQPQRHGLYNLPAEASRQAALPSELAKAGSQVSNAPQPARRIDSERRKPSLTAGGMNDVVRKMKAACESKLSGRIAGHLFIFLMDKYIFQFKLLDSAPGRDLIKSMIENFEKP